MCRIAGIIDYNLYPSEQLLLQMRDSMKHGGPDDAGIYSDKDWPLVMGHRRLALIDLSPAGHQPMMSDDNDIVIVFNGEIYNYLELQEELKRSGVSFRTASDTEVIIASYKKWGTACFEKFNGMFALALLDKKENVMILARDHAGIKPLYYSLKNGNLYFASEIRAFKALDKEWQENKDWKKFFLVFGHLPEPITTLQDVRPLQKASYLKFRLDTKEASIIQFSSFLFNYEIASEEQAVSLIKHKLDLAVKRHLISDAPIGLFLSGGVDSSILTILAKKYCGDNLQTLSIDFANEKYSERYYQQLIVDKVRAKHKAFIVTQTDFENALPDILRAMDQPSNDGINSYFISKYAKEYGLKAVLSGIGADELFGGYGSFNRSSLMQKIKWIPSFMLSIAEVSGSDKWKRVGFLKRRDTTGEYLFNRGFFMPAQVAALLDCTETEVEQLIGHITLPKALKETDHLERTSFYETNWYMQNQLLKDTDYMSMWHSVEVRVPFLDKELMAAVYAISTRIRYNKKQAKHLLIKAFADVLPPEIYNRPKQGFVFPFDKWMKMAELPFKSENPTHNKMYNAFLNDKIHWSRYWCYVLADCFSCQQG